MTNKVYIITYRHLFADETSTPKTTIIKNVVCIEGALFKLTIDGTIKVVIDYIYCEDEPIVIPTPV